MSYLRYSPDIETIDPDEQETIDGIIKGMTDESRIVEKRDHHAVRASHAKSTGLVIGELEIMPDLPLELAQGLFANPGSYPVAVRFAQGPGEKLSDKISTHRGMAIKVFNVEGEKLTGHDADTQDFVFASGPTFPSGTAAGFLRDAKQIGAATPMPEGFKSAVSSAARNFNRVLALMGTESPKADFFGHPFSHPLSEPYFSQAPLRFGDYVAKLGVFPVAPEQRQLEGQSIDVGSDENAFRTAVTAYFSGHEAAFEVRVQLWTNAKTQPIEDASVEWPMAESEYRAVATIRLPAQDAYSSSRERYFDEVMTFRPAHSLAAHRPLGSVMRARLQVYQALSAFRHGKTQIPEENTSDLSRIPA